MYICNNCKRTLIQKVYLKSCYVKLCKRLHLANYDITISPLFEIPGTLKFRCEFTSVKHEVIYSFQNYQYSGHREASVEL